MSAAPRILYCHCQYAQVVPPEVKEAVLRRLCDSGIAFDAVPDLCELSARRDPALGRLASGDAPLKIAACFPRAVKWLFAAAGHPLAPAGTEVLNMRALTADEIVQALLHAPLHPNLPAAQPAAQDRPSSTPAQPAQPVAPAPAPASS